MTYWGLPTQQPFTDFPLGENELFIGIPFVLAFEVNGTKLKQIGMYEYKPDESGNDVPPIRVWSVSDPTFPTLTTIAKTVMIYNDYYTFLTNIQRYYFSTIPNGNEFPTYNSNYNIVNPPNNLRYKIYRYFTDLKYRNINLNNYTTVELGWSSSDINGGQTISNYGNDKVIVSMYTSTNVFKLTSSMVTNGTTLPIQTFSTLPSGSYYFKYDFTSFRLQAINSYVPPASTPPFPYPPYQVYTFGSTDAAKTPNFTFITQFVQSVSANNILGNDTTSTIAINVGIGHTGYSYLLSINDVNDFSLRTTFPYTYTPPAVSNTKLYTVTVSNSSDTYDTGIHTTTFTAYKYITSITIANLIIESPKNFVSWVGGGVTDFFQYGTTPITTNGSTAFTVGDPMDTNLIVTGVPYRIKPSNINENIDLYPAFYFDSITPNTLQFVSNNSLQSYNLSWTSYFTSTFTAPDGTRQYPITITSSTRTYIGATTYNKFNLPFNEIDSGVAYTIEVAGIILGTGIYFFDTPTNFAITPSKINYNNTVTWTSNGNIVFNVRMGRYVFQSNSPYTTNLTQNIIDLTGDVFFWPVGSDETTSILTDSYFLSANTILVSLPSSILVFSGATLSFDVGTYLYPADTYSLSLYRNGSVVQQLEATITNPFAWIPYKYTVTYQPGDQLYIKSNQHLNFGISTPFTIIVDTPTNIMVVPSRINFSNTISWSVQNNPILNVKMGNYTFQSRSPFTQNLTEGIINPIGTISFWAVGSDSSRAVVAGSYTLSANTILVSLPSSILLFSGATLSFDVGTYLYPADTYSLSLYRNGSVVQQLEATITNPFAWIPFKYTVTYQPGDQLYIKSNQHLNFGLSVPFTIIVNTPTNIVITPSLLNFSNTISWSLENNPVVNVRMGNYVFQSSSPYTYNFIEDIINPIGTISFWAVGSDPTRAVVAGNYTLSANTIFVILPSSVFFFSGVFFSYDIGSVLYRNDTYSLSLYRNGAVVKQLEANVANPFTWFPYKYVVTYQPGDQLYVKSNQHLNFGLSVPFTFVVNASVVVDKSEYNFFSTIVANMTVDADTAFTAKLRGPVTIPVAFTQQGKQYTIQLKNYNIPLGNYRLDFLSVNSPTIIISSPTFVVTTSVTVDKPEYTIISTVNATVYVGTPTTFTILLQDVDQIFPAIVLPSFTANLLSTYSFRLYGLPVKDGKYVLRFTAATVLTSPVFEIITSYFSFDELIIPMPPSRATTNTLCVTTKKNNLPTTIISIKNNIVYPTAIRGQRQYLVPCGILPYLKELTELLKTLSLRDALLFLIQKYNIPQNTPAITNQKRYQLPTANSKVLNPILQFTTSFRLSSKVAGNSVPINTYFAEKLSDARVLILCNDDTKTFSTLYTDMLKNATYWISTLAQFKKDGDYTFCVVRPIQGTLKQFITASISLKDNVLIFTPVIARLVLSFYEPYGAVDFSIMFTSPLLSEIVKYLLAQYEKIYINPATAL